MSLHPSGFCEYFLEPEMREHMLLIYRQYSEERKLMMDGLREMGMVDGDENLELAEEFRRKKRGFSFLTCTGLVKRI